ncbi:MAG: hypothetical protein JK586_15785 [Nocardiopsis sp. BM-2018]|nr:MAG: hypothetical protein JK586_15785 [Nocardiopsis sp. BM-2018]
MTTTSRRAVIPAAGLGSRLLPLTRAIPKEMLPVGDKPVIEHAVRELVVSGGESLIQDHFRPAPTWSSACARTANGIMPTPWRRSANWPAWGTSPIWTSTVPTATAPRSSTRPAARTTNRYSSCGPTTSSSPTSPCPAAGQRL